MKAITRERYGSVVVREVPRPEPAPGEVLVRVRAASVNPVDWQDFHGHPYVLRLSRPRVLGRDFAGQVEGLGAGVTGFVLGDKVFGEAVGAFAEYVCVDEEFVARKPENLSYGEAAAVPLAGNTALVGLRDLGVVRPGQRVLVTGAAGGVGTFAVQVAKALGARVTGVCAAADFAVVRALGADEVDEEWGRDRFDVVFDLAGDRGLRAARRRLTRGGTLLLAVGGGYRGRCLLGHLGAHAVAWFLSGFVRHRLVPIAAKPSRRNLTALRDLVETNRLTPVVDRAYPLAETALAIHHAESPDARGKTVITG
ncbi:NAD(P)-dependent alcohol dehydrogenase [Actinokineospora auranticolor]|uniref:NADPH:quinone reductase-like Zn-dependent oxidoreductase n=1 Tax=Actinokineospora auranticolor TaxID=155976 RepID=A0A2S6GJQ7_9PSEU|nr:NAD(P)-dependent alcohol dehydrogenase [Actinokineospora auranticolor]PPK65468.1 NADPH:quinone reductase-like Zn-dependent oxidoreductase [Actinokineospora auranticolor]